MTKDTTTVARAAYTVHEVSLLLGIPRRSVYELARTGKLPGAFRLGGRVLVARVALDRLLDAAN